MTTVIVCEKPSAARNMASALGGTRGTFKSTGYEIVALAGHMYEYVSPSLMVPRNLSHRYHSWDLAYLPWDPDDLTWKRQEVPRAGTTLRTVAKAMGRADEIVIATDLDPTGEGDLLFWEVADELGIKGKRFSRMEFVDESAPSLREAFEHRRVVRSMLDEGDYRKALYRSQWDYLSLQWTRVATAMARASGVDTVLPQGRLKSAMVKLVGGQCKAHDEYVRKPYFQNRFHDENGVVYANPDEPRFDTAAQVPATHAASPVVHDGTERRRTAPPRLLDLGALSARLVARGVKPAVTLATYQKMYEAQVVSYPRTEDKTITPEQYNELLPLVDRIAGVVGVDPALLTHRQPRRTHVRARGAHGANRPGPRVPASLDDVEAAYGKAGRLIYEVLATNYLAMLAPDHEYDRYTGHVERYPAFVGHANVPRVAGWKAVFDADEDPDDEANDKGLGATAEPFVHEGANKRPQHPSMKWLVKQLEKRDVGTGATRTSTYAEVTNEKNRFQLLSERKNRVRLTHAGELSWRLLPGTHIGDLGTTEQVYADMRDIAIGDATGPERLAVVADWVRDDIQTMQANAVTMRSEMGLEEVEVKAVAEGTWRSPDGPRKVRFKRVWGGHEFTDAEVERLLAGESIGFEATSRAGKPFTASGRLGTGVFNGHKFVGFQLDVAEHPTSWCGHTFTDQEVRQLEAGKRVRRDDFVSARTGNTFGCEVSWDADRHRIVPHFDAGTPPVTWCGHTFTTDETTRLAKGEEIFVEGLTSKAGKTFDARLVWRKEKKSDKNKRIVPLFG